MTAITIELEPTGGGIGTLESERGLVHTRTANDVSEGPVGEERVNPLLHGGPAGPLREPESRTSMSDPVTRLNAALEGRYRIERELGEGGTATVYLADDIKHERKVALNVLKPELAAVVGAERFLAQIKTTGGPFC